MKLDFRKEIDNYIFDLGEVIVHLTPDNVIYGFSKHTTLPSTDLKKLLVNDPCLFDYETGRIDDDQFIEKVNQIYEMSLSSDDFEVIWNSMLHEIPIQKLQLLESLSVQAQTLVLSNTNAMHERGFESMIEGLTNGKRLADFVHHPYYSHHIGLRKPDVSSFQFLIDQHHLVPERTMFIDDKIENIEAARLVGLQTIHLTHPDNLYDYFTWLNGAK